MSIYTYYKINIDKKIKIWYNIIVSIITYYKINKGVT